MQKRSEQADSRYGAPQEEIKRRTQAFQELLRRQSIDLALIRQNADLFYLTGTVQDGHLLVPDRGDPVFLVWRVMDRARIESPLERKFPLSSLKALPSMLQDLDLADAKRIGLEMDVLPAFLYKFYSQNTWPHAEFCDISMLLRHIRRIKSPYEISCIEKACRQVKEAVAMVPEFLRPGISELELSAAVESELRKRGHCGLLRMRIWNQEMGMGQVLSGQNAAVASWTNTPLGGQGPHPAYGMGASFKRIKEAEPVSIDIGGWFNGYCCDQTRLFSIGQPPDLIKKSYASARDILKILEEKMLPGISCSSAYQLAVDYAEKSGLIENFMGYGPSRVRFIGHGLGIELDEFPFIARGNDMILEQNMIIALEPKFVFPGLGAAGIENTYRVTENGLERLTSSPQELVVL